MEWRDQGIVLGVRKHGETSAILDMFTPSKGRHAGVVRGGGSRKLAPILQPGAQLDVTWKARLEEHIGSFTVEPIRSRMVNLSDRRSLAGMNAVCALLLFTLPERYRFSKLYRHTENLLDLLPQQDLWPLAYLRWELALLEELGFGLDLSGCAVTGATQGLCYVSPKSGRAVTAAGAGEWADKLLTLPQCVLGQGDAPDDQIAQGFVLTGYFLSHNVAQQLGNKPLPEARQRFIDLFHRQIDV